MKYINNKAAQRIQELSDKGEQHYITHGGKRITMQGMYKGEGGSKGVCVNGLTEDERQELRSYNFVTSEEKFQMSRDGLWGTPTLLPNGKEYML